MKLLDTYWWQGKGRFLSMEIHREPSGSRFRVAYILHSRGSLRIEDSYVTSEWADVLTYLDQYIYAPILLDISGLLVLEEVLAEASGNVFQAFGIRREQFSQFHAQHLFTESQHPVGAMIRHDQLAEVLAEFGVHQDRIISLNLSAATGIHLLPQFVSLNGEMVRVDIRDKTYYLEQGLPTLPQDTDQFDMLEYTSGATEAGIEPENLVLAAHALSHIYLNSPGIISPQISEQEAAFRQRNTWYKSLGVAAVLAGIFLLFMLSNQLWYQFEVGRLEEQYQTSSVALDTIRSNRSRISEREETVNQLVSSTLKSSQIAWILDQVALKRPPDIRFTSCWYNPSVEQLKSLDAAERDDLDLILMGTAQASSSISTFSLALEQLPLIQSLEIHRSNFGFRSEEFEFVLFISFVPSL